MKKMLGATIGLLSLLVFSWAQTPIENLNFETGRVVGDLPLEEASGLANSHRNSGILYTHEDSGRGNLAYAVNESGRIVQTFRLTGVSNRDYEDIAINPDPQSGVPYVYIADLGNNDENAITMNIHRFPEPSLSPNQTARDTIARACSSTPPLATSTSSPSGTIRAKSTDFAGRSPRAPSTSRNFSGPCVSPASPPPTFPPTGTKSSPGQPEAFSVGPAAPANPSKMPSSETRLPSPTSEMIPRAKPSPGPLITRAITPRPNATPPVIRHPSHFMKYKGTYQL